MRLAQKQIGTTEQCAISFAPWSCHFAGVADRLGNAAIIVSANDRDTARAAYMTNIPEALSKTKLM